MFGSFIVVNVDEYLWVCLVVLGCFVSGYNRNDWIFGYLFCLINGGIRCVVGLVLIEGIFGFENMDVFEWVVGYMDYCIVMFCLFCECGWLVESDEFIEIEDLDLDNY